jgi:hypothetical protein
MEERKVRYGHKGGKEEEEKKYPGGAPWIFLAAFFHLTVTAGNTCIDPNRCGGCGRDFDLRN